MPRRVKPKAQKRDWRWYASLGLNGLVALSMVLGTVFLFTGASLGQRSAAVPTIAIPTESVNSGTPGAAATPAAGQPGSTPASSPAEPTPTPKASAHNNNAPPASPGQ